MTSLVPSQVSAISRLFSSGVIREMARWGKSPLFARLARESTLHKSHSLSDRVRCLFDRAFLILKQENHRHEYVYKAALTQKVLLGKHSLQTSVMLNEFRVGNCKADLAILNGTATAYEIKSERDSLSRLEQQIAAYKRVFARVYVIVGERHVGAVFNTVAPDVGVLRLSNRYQISTLREARECSQQTCPVAILDSIRIDEAKRILTQLKVASPEVPNTELRSAMRARFEKLDPCATHFAMVEVLKATRDLMPLAALLTELPYSLQTAALAVPLKKSEHGRLVDAVNTRLDEAMVWG